MDAPSLLHRFSLQVEMAAAELALAELWDIAPEGFEEHEAGLPGEDLAARFVLYASAEDAPRLAMSLQGLAERLERVTGLATSLESETIPDQNWRETWKVHFTLQRVPPFVIRPSWIEYTPSPDEQVIHLDPGSAFGTGLHESTRLCLRAIATLASQGASPGSVLDFGAGTGILGIAACRLFPCRVLAVDDDPLALSACDENSARNGVRELFRLEPALPPGGAFSNLTLANVSRPVLVEFAGALCDSTLPGGHLVLSGLLLGDADPVLEAFTKAGARLVEETRENDWLALRLARSGP
ncbi:MAG: 50S ribosomal protein L11 methyltransferase [Polyangia bacterium]|jgi:ribosomal protein L11 methyltransferase|nr:50S ribosomal protein L11 methyltransferase [Polyangia bacterium]